MSGGVRGHASALAPAVLLAAVFLGVFLFVSLLTYGKPIRVEVSTPALDSDPPTNCQRPCYSVNVSNVGGAAGNVMCQVQPPAIFSSGGATQLTPTPLPPGNTWVVYVISHTKHVPAAPPSVTCVPL